MHVELGMPVRTSDGHDVGRIHRLVLDPERDEVKAVAIRRGRLFHHDVEVPIGGLRVAADGGLRLAVPADRLHELPRFVESTYTSLLPDNVPAGDLPSSGVFLPGGYFSGAHEGTARHIKAHPAGETLSQLAVMFTQQDLANAVIGEGSEVRSRDAHTVGKLHQLSFESEGGRVTAFVVHRGWPAADLELPAALIAGFDDGVVWLSVDAAWLTMWAALTAGLEVWTSDRVCLGTLAGRARDHLEVVSLDQTWHGRVPMAAVDRLSDQRVLLSADRAQVRLWTIPAATEPSTGTRTWPA
jgi:sporulation protein YlmC with PRC-barrel domain